MGGADEVKPTEQEIAQADVHREQWERYEQNGIPLENEWIRQTTGYALNAETGEYEIDPTTGILNADGTVQTDTSSADTANEQAYGSVMQQVNPNRLETATRINREGAIQGGKSAAGMALGQQANARIGLVNAVAHGKGMEGEAMARQTQLTAQAQQEAFSSAQASADRSAANSYLVGTVGGLAGAAYGSRLDGIDPRQAQHPEFDPTVTRRLPGSHHS